MFGKELSSMIKLLEQVLKELKASNETQKQLLESINQNISVSKSLLIHVQALRANSEVPEAPTEGNHYRGDGGSSHKGDCKTKSEDAADCRSKCNGKCNDAGCA